MNRWLYNPTADFLLLGGGSLIALLAIRIASGLMGLDAAWGLGTTLFLANLINNPHFACSYQIFYGEFGKKLFSSEYEKGLRIRYAFIGIAAPIAIIGVMSALVAVKDVVTLGLLANLMFLLVGWHYVKQGYGMAMLDASLKKAFYTDAEKKLLLRNAYTAWLLAWLLVNYLTKSRSVIYFGIPYQSIAVPDWTIVVIASVALVSAAQCVSVICARKKNGLPIAWNGLIAYCVSLYAWLLLRDPVVVLWVPLFHSLQYLAVVWRFEVTRSAMKGDERVRASMRVTAFFAASFAIGYFMFWGFPTWLDAEISYDREVFGGSLFFFLSWIFINIHHYLLDTVMWRKGNPEVKKYLFSTSASKSA